MADRFELIIKEKKRKIIIKKWVTISRVGTKGSMREKERKRKIFFALTHRG